MRILTYYGARELKVEQAEKLPMNDNQARIRTMYSSISHGTEMNIYRGLAPFFNKKYDADTHLFLPTETEKWNYPIRSCDPGVWCLGYAAVGEVMEVGKNITKIRKGDKVFVDGPHQTEIVREEDRIVKLPEIIDPSFGVLYSNLNTAFNGILDTDIKLGSTVVVSGLGVLGQLVVQMAKLSGAFNVIGVDVFEKRLEVAKECGADYVFNPDSCDVAMEVRKLTNNIGADAVIEVSGSAKALNEAIRIVAYSGTVTALSWYPGQCSQLNLSEEFHHNRIRIVCSQTNGISPENSHLWTFGRRRNIVCKLLEKLNIEKLITHRIPYENAPEAYKLIDRNNSETIQVILEY